MKEHAAVSIESFSANSNKVLCLILVAYIDIPTGLSTLGDSSCPENSLINLNDLVCEFSLSS